MKTAAAAALITLAAFLSPLCSAADEHAGHGAMHGATSPATDFTDGLVKKVDKVSGKLTIAHGALVNLGMSPMTMVFSVKDPAWLAQIKDGDKIRFKAENLNGSITVVQLEKAK